MNSDLPREKQFDFLDIFRTIFRHKIKIFLLSLICGVIFTSISYLITPLYESEVIMQPITQESSSGIGGLSALSGAATIAGINLSTSSDIESSIAFLNSRFLARTFIEKYKLIPLLYPDLYDLEKKQWKKDISPPILWEAVSKFLNNVMIVNRDQLTEMASISIVWSDPNLAAEWANNYLILANETIRDRKLNEIDKQLEYLRKEYETLNNNDLRSATTNLILNQMNSYMLVQSNSEYAFKIIDPAIAAPLDKKSSPKRAIYALLGLLMGFAIGFLWGIIIDSGNENLSKNYQA